MFFFQGVGPPRSALLRLPHVPTGCSPVRIVARAAGEVGAQLALGGAREVVMTRKAALDAFPGWAATPPHVRARALFRFRDLIGRDLDRLAALITAEHGKHGRASCRERVGQYV